MSTQNGRFKHSVKLMYLSGESIKFIAKSKERTIEEIEEVLLEYKMLWIGSGISSEILGSKKEQYYEKEDDMFYLPKYTYEDLSTDEKQIYDESRSD
jgi:hypothetical protein